MKLTKLLTLLLAALTLTAFAVGCDGGVIQATTSSGQPAVSTAGTRRTRSTTTTT